MPHLLDQFTVQNHLIAKNTNDPLPVNVQLTCCPPCLFTFNGERAVFDYALFSNDHFLTRIDEDYFVLRIDSNVSLVNNGHLKRSWTDNLSRSSQAYFIETADHRDCIMDIRESTVIVWQLVRDTDNSSSVTFLYSIDDGTSTTTRQSTHRQVTRYGRETAPQQTLDLSSFSLTDYNFDQYNNLLTLLFELEHSDEAIIRVIEHPSGLCRQSIPFKKHHKHNQLKIMHEHEKLIVQELSCHTLVLRVFSLRRSA
jgi:hypothetical protein